VGLQLREAAHTYTERRQALIEALARRGVAASGRSGMNVWVPVPDEQATASALLATGFAVLSGAPFRIRSAPAVRVTTATLQPDEAEVVADALAAALAPAGRSSAA